MCVLVNFSAIALCELNLHLWTVELTNKINNQLLNSNLMYRFIFILLTYMAQSSTATPTSCASCSWNICPSPSLSSSSPLRRLARWSTTWKYISLFTKIFHKLFDKNISPTFRQKYFTRMWQWQYFSTETRFSEIAIFCVSCQSRGIIFLPNFNFLNDSQDYFVKLNVPKNWVVTSHFK